MCWGRKGTVDPPLDTDDVLAICRGLAELAHLQDVYYLWRPLLKDPKDDLVLEAALASASRYIVTHNIRDFTGKKIEKGLGVEIVIPKTFLGILQGESQ